MGWRIIPQAWGARRCARRSPPGSCAAMAWRTSIRSGRSYRCSAAGRPCSPLPRRRSTAAAPIRSSSAPIRSTRSTRAPPCSPGNPTGKVMALEEWERLFRLADRYGFVIASDECYSEIYFEEGRPPLGALEAAQQLGREGFPNLVIFSSLSKRSNVPGMRSGFVAGSAALLEKFLLYRTYHGCAMNPAVQAASAAAWRDEAHVAENRRMYLEKFAAVPPLLQQVDR